MEASINIARDPEPVEAQRSPAVKRYAHVCTSLRVSPGCQGLPGFFADDDLDSNENMAG
jgi:hypothetical protein